MQQERGKKKQVWAHSTGNYLLKIDEIKCSQGAPKSLALSNYKLLPLYGSQIITRNISDWQERGKDA